MRNLRLQQKGQQTRRRALILGQDLIMSLKPSCVSFPELLATARQGSTQAVGVLISAYRDYLLYLANRQLPYYLRCKAGPYDLVPETIYYSYYLLQQYRGVHAGE